MHNEGLRSVYIIRSPVRSGFSGTDPVILVLKNSAPVEFGHKSMIFLTTHTNLVTVPQWEKTSVGVRQPSIGH